MDERKLVEQAKAGDFTAFQSLVEPHQKRLFALAKKMTRNVQDAEDIVQDTLLKAIDNLEQFRAESSFGTWLYSIALNAGRHHLVHQKRQAMTPIEDLLAGTTHHHDSHHLREWRDPHSVMEADEIRKFISEAVDEMPAEYSVPFILRYEDELSIKEIADLLKLSEAATKSRVLRARLFLREKLDTILKIEDNSEKVR
ncbi:MAG: sigma-70 family RNA polymerase sigma factor [Candidatus Zixiibacteriota bacterium]|nr:MAG: sigma-70 family RNA polymerase sigma factor [candidate division Zixibacteria bacterium]